jgi:hypothetical protein
MDLLSFKVLFLIIGAATLVLSIPFVIRNWGELEAKGFEPKQYLVYTLIAVIVILFALAMVVSEL